MFQSSAGGRILLANDAFCRMMGYSRAELQALHVLDITYPEDRQADAERLDQAAAGLLGDYSMEKRYRRKDGSVLWASVTVMEVACEAGRPSSVISIVQDIADRRRAEEQLRQWSESLERRVAERTAQAERRAAQLRSLAAQLVQAEQRERRRIAQVLHDHLQQLLVGARFALRTLLRSPRDPDPPSVLRRIDEAIAQSLLVSRSLTAELCPPVVYQGSMSESLRWLANWFADRHGLAVEVLADGQADSPAEEIRVVLFQSARELLFNIVKHAGVSRAGVQLSRLGNDQVQLAVWDEGIGFDPARLETSRQVGSGLGLFSVRERLEWLGGSLGLESVPRQGTRATVTLPTRIH